MTEYDFHKQEIQLQEETKGFIKNCFSSESSNEISAEFASPILSFVSKARESMETKGMVHDSLVFQGKLNESGGTSQMDLFLAESENENIDIDEDPQTRKHIKILIAENGTVANISTIIEKRQLDKWQMATYMPEEDSASTQEYKLTPSGWEKVEEEEDAPIEFHKLDNSNEDRDALPPLGWAKEVLKDPKDAEKTLLEMAEEEKTDKL